jgi:acetyl esterase/lipase
MKKLFPVIFLFILVACQKEPTQTVVDTPLAEQTITNVSYGTDTAQRMDIYLPANRTTATTKAIIMVHGGAWISGDKVDMNQFIPVIKSRLSEYAIFNLNYRLAALPATNTFPAQENDVKAAVNFIIGKANDYKFSTSKTVILGASAGAQMALLQAYKNSSPKFKAVVDLFGPTDMAGIYNAYASSPVNQLGIQLLMNGTPATNAALYQSSSPINFVSAQSPPTLILHGTADPVVPYVQSTTLKTKLDAAGVYAKMITYPGAGHGDWDAATFDDAYTQVVNFLVEKNP